MDQTRKQNVVPLWAVLACKRKNKYGSISDLPDDELADPEELERQMLREEFGPVLALPVRGTSSGFRPAIDEQGDIDWGAFGTVDFERTRPAVQLAKRKLVALVARREDLIIMYELIMRRLPRVKYVVLERLRKGQLDLGHIENFDMYMAGELHLRLLRMNQAIERLREEGR